MEVTWMVPSLVFSPRPAMAQSKGCYGGRKFQLTGALSDDKNQAGKFKIRAQAECRKDTPKDP